MYPFSSSDQRTNVAFNESTVLKSFDPIGSFTATSGATIKVWYSDEHALTLGVRRVIVKTTSGSTTMDYPVTPLCSTPASGCSVVANQTCDASHSCPPGTACGADGICVLQVGASALNGDQAGTDACTCTGAQDLCDRPMFPALFITDITNDPNSRSGDWQSGGTPIPPHAVFGTWKSAVRTVDRTKTPPLVTVTPDPDPAKNNYNLAGGDAPPSSAANEGYGAEVRWDVDTLIRQGRIKVGHAYRLEFMVHDGDQNKAGGDSGENCVNVLLCR